ncbi:response regulator [Pseudoflavitalea rhizosphaerae]|uniref:response regulator n=1 Tax=Pseudoflavitalea rhizosphaerae TaxID=1884793 RepID=UPI000F8DD91C|nr:response regulator [Pseudoflavitalea rhizosphaerae]
MKKILLIEDNNDIRENTAEILSMANYQVITAENGKSGVESALREKPDLIICDIMMPVLDGYGVLHMLHKQPGVQHTPFIFLSAKAERSDIRKGMELGADDYITKPFTGTELLNAVESRFKKLDLSKQELPADLYGLNTLLKSSNGKDLLKNLSEDRNINKYKKKHQIYAEGYTPSKLFFIQKGKVRTFKTNEEGKDLVTGLFNEGEFLGYLALLEGTSYKETAEALEDTELAVIPREDFEELMNNNRDVMHKFIQLLARNITEKEQQLLGLAYNSLRKKVADALVTLQKKYKSSGEETFTIDISRENLASIAGTATESLIRTLSDFKSEKLIDIKEGRITVLNEKKLGQMLN